MNFLPYEDVPLYLAVSGYSGEHIFAESAQISLSHNLTPVRQADDQIFQICEYGLGLSMNYSPFTFTANTNTNVTLGPTKGPPRPLATSIYKIPANTKISFPNNKHLFFTEDAFPNGHDYTASVYAKSGGWSLSEGEAQSGYFEPIFKNVTQSPVEGSLSVNFYVDTGNLKSFFNITGLSSPFKYPPLDEEKITGYLGDFRFSDVYLNNFNFSLSPNSISQASASFKVYGELTYDESITDNYFSSSLYSQNSIGHGTHSQIIGANEFEMDHPVSLDYSISVERGSRYSMPTGFSSGIEGLTPDRVSKKSTVIEMSIGGEHLNPNLLSGGFGGRRANLKAQLKDLSYSSFEDNSNGTLHEFSCSGTIQSQNISISSAGHLNGSISVRQLIK